MLGGYWRDNITRIALIECYNTAACLGGFNTNETYPVQCDVGY